MSALESMLAGLAARVADRLIDAALSDEPLRGIPLAELVKKAEWQKLERAALREAAKRRLENAGG